LDWTKFKALSFDCYGTLIDWEAGLGSVLVPWAREVGRRTGTALGRPVSDTWAERLGSSVPDWPAFPDSGER
jgi:putative hydrolase of the HAD superfamily